VGTPVAAMKTRPGGDQLVADLADPQRHGEPGAPYVAVTPP
jgi:hypothetical protein